MNEQHPIKNKLLATSATAALALSGGAATTAAAKAEAAPQPVIAGATVAPTQQPAESAGGTAAPEQPASSPNGGTIAIGTAEQDSQPPSTNGGTESPNSPNIAGGTAAAPTPAERQQMDMLAQTGMDKLAQRIVSDAVKPGWKTTEKHVKSVSGQEGILDTQVSSDGRTADFTVYAKRLPNGQLNLSRNGVDQVVIKETGGKGEETIGFDKKLNGDVTVGDSVYNGYETKGSDASTGPAGPNVPVITQPKLQGELSKAGHDVTLAERNKHSAI